MAGTLTLEHIYAIPESSIRDYLTARGQPSQGFPEDRFTATILYARDGFLTPADREVVQTPEFTDIYRSSDEELINRVQERDIQVTVLMTKANLIRTLLTRPITPLAGPQYTYDPKDLWDIVQIKPADWKIQIQTLWN